jgi:hypothetical protein
LIEKEKQACFFVRHLEEIARTVLTSKGKYICQNRPKAQEAKLK